MNISMGNSWCVLVMWLRGQGMWNSVPRNLWLSVGYSVMISSHQVSQWLSNKLLINIIIMLIIAWNATTDSGANFWVQRAYERLRNKLCSWTQNSMLFCALKYKYLWLEIVWFEFINISTRVKLIIYRWHLGWCIIKRVINLTY